MLYVQKLILFLPRGAKVDQKSLAVRQESKLEERHHQEASLWLNLSHHGKPPQWHLIGAQDFYSMGSITARRGCEGIDGRGAIGLISW